MRRFGLAALGRRGLLVRPPQPQPPPAQRRLLAAAACSSSSPSPMLPTQASRRRLLPPLRPPLSSARDLSISNSGGGGSADPPTHPSLSTDEVERLEEAAADSWRASRELGMRYLKYGKRLGPDAERALEWLEKAGTQMLESQPQSSSSSTAASEEEERELWYARALACLRVDRGLQEGAVVEGEEWMEEVETERYGAKTGVEFVRVVRRRANQLKKARAKESVAARVAPKHKRALVRFEKAAELGHVEAMIQMGNIFYENVDEDEAPAAATTETDKTNLQRAVECYRRAATAEGHDGGHPDAWYNLGTIVYEGGPGVPRDVPTAIECFTAAAASPQEQSGSAAYWLGHLYRIGDPAGGVRPNREKALRFMQEACETKQHPAACFYLALLFRNGERELELLPDPKAFQTYLQKAEALEDPEALFCLADMHLHGSDGVERDEGRAINYYKKAGQAGHAGALITLGALFHQRGRYTEALDLYQRAGELGSIEAWRNLASMYMLGQGTAKNEGMARHIIKTIANAEAEEREQGGA